MAADRDTWSLTTATPAAELVVAVQAPVAVIGFVPIATPWIHLASFAGALGLTAFSLWYVRRLARTPGTATVPAS